MPRLPRFHRLAPVPGEYLSRAALPPPSVKRGRVKRCRRRASLRLIERQRRDRRVISPHQTCDVGPFRRNLLIFGETLQQVGARNDYCLVFDHY